MQIEFRDPPFSTRHNQYNWAEITDTLRANKGKWALINNEEKLLTRGGAQTARRRLLNGTVRGANPDEFEAVTRGVELYARYVGKKNTG